MSDVNLNDFFNEEAMMGAIAEQETKRFWRPTKPKTIIRILPPLKPLGEKLFYFTHRVHWVNKIPYECINQTQVDKDGHEHIAENCSLCNLARKLYKLGDSGDEESRKFASQISGKLKNVVRIVVRGEEENEGKIFFYELPGKVHKMLMDNISSGEWGSVVHPTKGRDLILIKNGTGMLTDYSSSQLSPKETPIYSDMEKTVSILKEAVKKPYISLVSFRSSAEIDNIVKELISVSSETNYTVSNPAPASKPTPVEEESNLSFISEQLDVAEDNSDIPEPESDNALDDLLAELA